MADSESGSDSGGIGAPGGPRIFSGADENAWKVWWLWGVPVAWIASALVVAAEQGRIAGLNVLADLLDVARLAVYWFWCRLAWRSSGHALHPAWRLLGRGVLAAGFVLNVFI